MADLLHLGRVGRSDSNAAELSDQRTEGRRGDERGAAAVVAHKRDLRQWSRCLRSHHCCDETKK